MATLLQQSAAFMQFKATQILSFIGDASRIGNPAESCEVMAAWCPEVGVAVWLPPQAFQPASMYFAFVVVVSVGMQP
eukprot:9845233-Heterocapsa_arctica.AAC.1